MVTHLMAVAQAATNASPGQAPALTIALSVLGSSVVAGLIGAILGNTRANATARRERYAQAVRCLVAWAEYPYRIRRRTSDDPATLTTLADRGHTLQEQLAESRAWIAAESRAMSEVFDGALREVTALVGPACGAAWQEAPIATSAGMNLGDFGPRGIDLIVARMECAIIYRFGLRRLIWRRWVLHRLRRRDCPPKAPGVEGKSPNPHGPEHPQMGMISPRTAPDIDGEGSRAP